LKILLDSGNGNGRMSRTCGGLLPPRAFR
jgi:hypothetical protein